MPFTVTKSKSTDFGGVLKSSQFHHEINDSITISTVFKHIQVDGDNVIIVFDSEPSSAELIALDVLISTHAIITNTPGNIFDAVVAADGTQRYKLISDAISEGHTNIMVRHGVYVEPLGFNFSGVSVTGESGVGCIVHLAGQPVSVRADASNGVKENVGTIVVTRNSTDIVGTGTTFTNLSNGDFIALGTNYFEIASISDNTNLTLVDMYVGADMLNVSYTAQTMATGTHMSNILIIGSTVAGLYIRGQRHYFIDSVAVKSCGAGFEIVDCGDSSARQLISETCGSDGIIINGCISMAFSVIDVYNHPGDGIKLLGNNTSIVFTQCESTSCGGNGINIGGISEDIKLVNVIQKFNHVGGIYVGTNCESISVSNAVMSYNSGIGINMVGTNLKLSNSRVCDNLGIGINITGNNSTCIDVTTNGNTDGIRVNANDCIISLCHSTNNSLDGLHIVTGSTDTIATYNNLKGNITNNLVNNGTMSETTGNKV
jgi:hypothetical protein